MTSATQTRKTDLASQSPHRPDFIGIGMERAGTSWVFRMLAAHPEIWVPPIKELHYFDLISPEMQTRRRRFTTHLRSRVRQKGAMLWRFRNRPEFYKNSATEYLRWDARFFTGPQDDAWYRSLFDETFTKGRVCGEMTPAYSNLSREMVNHIHEFNPEMKFILTLRDPVERAWSGMIRQFCGVKKRAFESITEQEMLDYLQDTYVHANSNLPEILRLWNDAVPSDRLFIRKTTDMREQPEAFLRDLYEFLGVEPAFVPPADLLSNEVNTHTRQSYEKPRAVEDYLQDAFGGLASDLGAAPDPH